MLSAERRGASVRRGMTVLGKIPVVPKPVNLPSQRLENKGHDPNVELVPRGSVTWATSTGRSPPTAGGAWGLGSSPPTSSTTNSTSLAPWGQNAMQPTSNGPSGSTAGGGPWLSSTSSSSSHPGPSRSLRSPPRGSTSSADTSHWPAPAESLNRPLSAGNTPQLPGGGSYSWSSSGGKGHPPLNHHHGPQPPSRPHSADGLPHSASGSAAEHHPQQHADVSPSRFRPGGVAPGPAWGGGGAMMTKRQGDSQPGRFSLKNNEFPSLGAEKESGSPRGEHHGADERSMHGPALYDVPPASPGRGGMMQEKGPLQESWRHENWHVDGPFMGPNRNGPSGPDSWRREAGPPAGPQGDSWRRDMPPGPYGHPGGPGGGRFPPPPPDAFNPMQQRFRGGPPPMYSGGPQGIAPPPPGMFVPMGPEGYPPPGPMFPRGRMGPPYQGPGPGGEREMMMGGPPSGHFGAAPMRGPGPPPHAQGHYGGPGRGGGYGGYHGNHLSEGYGKWGRHPSRIEGMMHRGPMDRPGSGPHRDRDFYGEPGDGSGQFYNGRGPQQGREGRPGERAGGGHGHDGDVGDREGWEHSLLEGEGAGGSMEAQPGRSPEGAKDQNSQADGHFGGGAGQREWALALDEDMDFSKPVLLDGSSGSPHGGGAGGEKGALDPGGDESSAGGVQGANWRAGQGKGPQAKVNSLPSPDWKQRKMMRGFAPGGGGFGPGGGSVVASDAPAKSPGSSGVAQGGPQSQTVRILKRHGEADGGLDSPENRNHLQESRRGSGASEEDRGSTPQHVGQGDKAGASPVTAEPTPMQLEPGPICISFGTLPPGHQLTLQGVTPTPGSISASDAPPHPPPTATGPSPEPSSTGGGKAAEEGGLHGPSGQEGEHAPAADSQRSKWREEDRRAREPQRVKQPQQPPQHQPRGLGEQGRRGGPAHTADGRHALEQAQKKGAKEESGPAPELARKVQEGSAVTAQQGPAAEAAARGRGDSGRRGDRRNGRANKVEPARGRGAPQPPLSAVATGDVPRPGSAGPRTAPMGAPSSNLEPLLPSPALPSPALLPSPGTGVSPAGQQQSVLTGQGNGLSQGEQVAPAAAAKSARRERQRKQPQGRGGAENAGAISQERPTVPTAPSAASAEGVTASAPVSADTAVNSASAQVAVSVPAPASAKKEKEGEDSSAGAGGKKKRRDTRVRARQGREGGARAEGAGGGQGDAGGVGTGTGEQLLPKEGRAGKEGSTLENGGGAGNADGEAGTAAGGSRGGFVARRPASGRRGGGSTGRMPQDVRITDKAASEGGLDSSAAAPVNLNGPSKAWNGVRGPAAAHLTASDGHHHQQGSGASGAGTGTDDAAAAVGEPTHEARVKRAEIERYHPKPFVQKSEPPPPTGEGSQDAAPHSAPTKPPADAQSDVERSNVDNAAKVMGGGKGGQRPMKGGGGGGRDSKAGVTGPQDTTKVEAHLPALRQGGQATSAPVGGHPPAQRQAAPATSAPVGGNVPAQRQHGPASAAPGGGPAPRSGGGANVGAMLAAAIMDHVTVGQAGGEKGTASNAAPHQMQPQSQAGQQGGQVAWNGGRGPVSQSGVTTTEGGNAWGRGSAQGAPLANQKAGTSVSSHGGGKLQGGGNKGGGAQAGKVADRPKGQAPQQVLQVVKPPPQQPVVHSSTGINVTAEAGATPKASDAAHTGQRQAAVVPRQRNQQGEGGGAPANPIIRVRNVPSSTAAAGGSGPTGTGAGAGGGGRGSGTGGGGGAGGHTPGNMRARAQGGPGTGGGGGGGRGSGDVENRRDGGGMKPRMVIKAQGGALPGQAAIS